MFSKGARWRRPQPSGPGPGAYTIPFGAGFTFGRRWKVHETCLPRCRLVAAPAPVPAPPRPTLLTARSAAQADIVGQGALAQVIVGHVDGRKVARKVTHDAKRNDELWKEFEILKLVGGHPNIVQVIELEAKASRHAILMEMLGPSLLNMLRIPGVAPFAIPDVAVSLLRALDHIHGFFVAHCDVSARNLCSKRGWHMVLIDFDSAQIHRSLDELSEGQVNLEHFRRQDLSSLHSRNMNARGRLCGC